MELAHRLVTTRGGTALLAVITAVAAAAIVLVYVNRYRDGVTADATPVTVLVAQHAIAKGTAGEVVLAQSLFSTEKLRSDEAATGAVVDASALRGKVATRDIAPGEQLTAALFGSSVSTLSAKLAGNQRAVSVPVDPARGLVGKIEAGDRVDVVAGFDTQSGTLSQPVTKVIMQSVPVIGVSTQDSGNASPTTQNGTITLRVSTKQAAELAFASDNGKLWFVLRPRAGSATTQAAVVDLASLLAGGK